MFISRQAVERIRCGQDIYMDRVGMLHSRHTKGCRFVGTAVSDALPGQEARVMTIALEATG